MLYAQIEPTESLVKLNRDKQKIYTSIEVEPNFSDSGEAYLMGLAVTDSPEQPSGRPQAEPDHFIQRCR